MRELLLKLGFHKYLLLVNIVLLGTIIFLSLQKIDSNSRYKAFYNDIKKSNIQIANESKITTCTDNEKDNEKDNKTFYGDIGLRANMKHYKAELTDETRNATHYLTTVNSLKRCAVDTNEYMYIGS